MSPKVWKWVRRATIALGIGFVVLTTGCQVLDTLASIGGAPAPGAQPSVGFQIIEKGANMAPGWIRTAVLGLTTALGFYRDHKTKKTLEAAVVSVDKGKESLTEAKYKAVWLFNAAQEKFAAEDSAAGLELIKEGIAAIADGNNFKDFMKAAAIGFSAYEDLHHRVNQIRWDQD